MSLAAQKNRPTLRQLEYVVQLADHLHFGRAARAAGVSQPGLSSQLKQLEDLLGQRLFERSSRGVAITEAGRVLAESAREMLARLDETLAAIDPTHHVERDVSRAHHPGMSNRSMSATRELSAH